MSKNKKIYFITGASGVGKTTLLDQLKEKYSDKDWKFFHFDSIGVPTPEEMERDYGSGANWQKAKTEEWIDRLINQEPSEKIFLEGQVNLEFILAGFRKHNFEDYKIILVDCSDEEMAYRLTEKRNQPELLTEDMRNWLKFLRNQAGELGVSIIDTTDLSKEETLDKFLKIIEL